MNIKLGNVPSQKQSLLSKALAGHCMHSRETLQSIF